MSSIQLSGYGSGYKQPCWNCNEMSGVDACQNLLDHVRQTVIVIENRLQKETS